MSARAAAARRPAAISQNAVDRQPCHGDLSIRPRVAAYSSAVLEAREGGVYIAPAPTPTQGWTAYFVELDFPGGGSAPFKFTTGVRITPDVLPFASPPRALSETPPSK
jgi:PhoPQ-activated pathogenicity-related protein